MAFNVQKALKDGYTMEEINQYLKSSSSTPTPQSSQPKGNNLAEKAMNLLQDLSSPIRFAKSAAIQSPILALTGGRVNTYDLPGFGKMTGLSEQELQKMYGDGSLKQRATKTMTQAGKEGLEAASYGVPFGKGTNILTKALLPGASIGAMQSLSGDNPTAKDVGISSLLSMLTAGVLNKVPGGEKAASKGISSILPEEKSGNILSKALTGTGKEIKGAGRNFERVVQNNPFFTSSLEKMNKVSDDLRLAGSNKAQLQKAEKSFNEITDQVSTKLKSSNVKIPSRSLFTDLSERLKTTPYYDPTDPKYLNETRKIFNEINKSTKGGVIDINDIYKAKQSIGSKYKKAWTKATPNEADIVAMNMYNELKNIINEAVPGVSKLTEKQSTIFDITNALGKSINTSTVTLGALTPKVPGMARGTQALTNQLGRTIEGLGAATRGAKTPQNESVTKLLSILSSPQMQKAGAVGASRVASQPTQEQVGNPQAGNTVQLGNGYSYQVPTRGQEQGQEQPQQVITNEELTLLMLLDPKNASTYSAIAELQGGGATEQKPLSSTTENRVQLANSGLRALNELESLYQNDPTKVLKSKLPGSIGARDYESASLRAVEGLLRARSGAAVPETEVIRYRNANLPRVGDSRQTALNKLAAFRKDLEEVANSGATMPNNLEVLQNAGIDLGL